MPDLKCTVTDMCAQLQVPVRFGQDSGGRRYCKDCTGDLLRQLSGEKRRQLYECSSFRPVSF